MDNWFTTLQMIEHLLSNALYVTGTIRRNRLHGLPNGFMDARPERRAWNSRSKEGVTVVRYYDRKDVFLITTFTNGGSTAVQRRRKRADGSYGLVSVDIPTVVHQYNNRMNRVDVMDQQLNAYPVQRRSISWVHKLFFHLLGMVEVTSYELYKQLGPETRAVTLSDFRKLLVKGLIEAIPPATTTIEHTMGYHPTKKACRVCVVKRLLTPSQIRHGNTKLICTVCPNKPAFCPEHYHEFHRDIARYRVKNSHRDITQ
jgi:hypothetical protein